MILYISYITLKTGYSIMIQPTDIRKKKILIIANNRIGSSNVSDILENIYDVVCISSTSSMFCRLVDVDERPDLILFDLNASALNNIEMLDNIHAITSKLDIPIICLADHYDDKILNEYISAGVVDFLLNPITFAIIHSRIASTIELYEYRHQIIESIADIFHRPKTVQRNAIANLSKLITKRNPDTWQHIKNTTLYTKAITASATTSGVLPAGDERWRKTLLKSVPFHDIGKATIPNKILFKPDKLTDNEFAIIKTHCTHGANLIHNALSGIEEPSCVAMAENIARFHHERWDGTGYPSGISATDIPLEARITAIADVFDALTSKRVYKSAYTDDEAFSIIISESGTHFDPELVSVFASNFNEIKKAKKTKGCLI